MSAFPSLARRPLTRMLPALLALAASAGSVSTFAHSARLSRPGPLVHFPADQAAHPNAVNEWWYVVGHMHSARRTFGYEVTIFKFHNLRAPGLPNPISLFRADVAITDEEANRFHEHVTYYFPAAASASATTLHIKTAAASLSALPGGGIALRASLPAGAIALRLVSRRSPMYVGGRGYIPLGNGHSYYYSLTDLASQGTIRVGRTTFTVSGVSWLDHQWGRWDWTSIRGWTWMALQLTNGVQLSVFDFRGMQTHLEAASISPKTGKTITLPGISITSSGTWRSPHTRAVYPSGWTVSIPEVRATLRVAPSVKDQEVTSTGAGPASAYWEGSGRVSGTWHGRAVSGLSYTELTGYAGSFVK